MLHVLFSVYLKMLVLYSPFFVLSCFISLTRGYSNKERRRLAWKVALATLISSVLLYLFGRTIFNVFGITVDAFRIGAGSVLFISALGMAQGKSAVQTDNVGANPGLGKRQRRQLGIGLHRHHCVYRQQKTFARLRSADHVVRPQNRQVQSLHR